jgi:nucleotide-binding universal stress UspA family protein
MQHFSGRTKMASYSRILLCYDATREGHLALRRGADLALQLQAQTHLLAVLNNTGWGQGFEAPPVDLTELQETSARDILREGVADLATFGVFATGHLAIGNPAVQIPRYARELDADLIVLGHHRQGRLARWWTGNMDGQLLDGVDCSVLVVVDEGGGVARHKG